MARAPPTHQSWLTDPSPPVSDPRGDEEMLTTEATDLSTAATAAGPAPLAESNGEDGETIKGASASSPGGDEDEKSRGAGADTERGGGVRADPSSAMPPLPSPSMPACAPLPEAEAFEER